MIANLTSDVGENAVNLMNNHIIMSYLDKRKQILVVDVASKEIIYTTPACEELYGSRPEKIKITDLNAEELNTVLGYMKKVAQSGAGGFFFNTLHNSQQGTPLPVKVNSLFINIENNPFFISQVILRKQVKWKMILQHNRSNKLIMDSLADICKILNITPVEGLILCILLDNPNPTTTELTDYFYWEKSTTSRILNKLIEKELIKVYRTVRKKHVLTTTAAGKVTAQLLKGRMEELELPLI